MAELAPPKTTKPRGLGKPWKPGQSGNPGGRPPGTGLSGELRRAIADRAPAIVQSLIKQAEGGDVQAARALLDRIVPPLKASAAPVIVAGLTAGTPLERAAATLSAAGEGQLPPDLAAAIVGALGTLARIRESEELEARIRALELKQ
tara:strand:+ start:12354 stop:12794 length:441 start_codon:yes stop_codon:yes gene_type:complete